MPGNIELNLVKSVSVNLLACWGVSDCIQNELLIASFKNMQMSSSQIKIAPKEKNFFFRQSMKPPKNS